MFDAMYFYGLWINHTRATGVDHRDGRAMLAFSDGFSFNCTLNVIKEPVREETNNLGFRPGQTQTGLYSHRRKLET